jgi:uncharacterized membrane protein YidH (DUF202 family)
MSLQPERTDLAWRRTGISTVALALVGLRLAADEGGVEVVTAVVATMAAAGVALVARWRSAQLLRTRSVPEPLSRPAGLLLAATVLVLDAAAVVLVLGAPG